jgi:hypothetical protein
MSYSSVHETTDLRTYAFKERAPRARSRIAFLRCLRPQALPDPFSQRPQRTCASDSRKSRVWLPDGAQRYPCLQRAWSRRPRSWLLAPQGAPRCLRREWGRNPTRDAPPRPQEIRQRGLFVDAFDGRRSELRARHNQKKGQWRDHPGDALEAGGALAEGQTLDGEPRSGVRPKKGIEIG